MGRQSTGYAKHPAAPQKVEGQFFHGRTVDAMKTARQTYTECVNLSARPEPKVKT